MELEVFFLKKKVTNHDLINILASKGIETSDEWISSRSGIKTRYFSEKNDKSSDLALNAAKNALNDANLDKDDIDLIIVATSTPDNFGGFPSTACVLQNKIGIKNQCPAFDVQAVCSGFVYAMSIADSYIKNGAYKKVLVVGAEVFSKILNFNDRSTCVLFGDGAGAIVLEANSDPGILSTVMHSNGKYSDILAVPGSLNDGVINGEPFLKMDGPAVFKLGVSVMTQVALEILNLSKKVPKDVDWLIPHQANIRIIEATAKKLGISLTKTISTVDKHGNTSAASIPLALDSGYKNDKVKSGDLVLLEGVGGGFTWGAVLVKM